MEPRIQYTQTSDGVNIAYWKIGEGAPIVITPYHAFSHIGMEWQHEINRGIYLRLADQRSVVRYDPRGSGLSQRVIDPELDAQVRDLLAVVQAAEAETIVIIGMGFGGPGAVRFAAEHPGLVTHLILYDTFLRYDDLLSTPMFSAVRTVADKLESNMELLGRTWASMFGADIDWFGKYVKASWTVDAAEAFRHVTLDCSAWVESVHCPTLVLHEEWPEDDVPLSRNLAARLPRGELVVIPRSHTDEWNDFADFSSLVYDFIGLTPPTSSAPAAEATSRVTAVLFTDLVGHTEMMSRLGDERGREVLREHERITREVLKANGGTEVKTMGDGFMASFGSVTKAVECAVALQRAVDAWNTGVRAQGLAPLRVRCGLNAGEPIEEDGDLFGATVILASRIAAKADGGEILVADTVRGLCSGKGFLFADRGEFVAKGFEEPVRVYEVRWREDA